MPLTVATSQIADGLRSTRAEAISRQEEQVFMVDVDKRLVAWNSSDGLVSLDPALNIELYTARSELIDGRKGRIRFFPDGSSTGGQIDLELAGDNAAVQIHWADGRVTVKR
jgi:general secretion pathway protein H